MSQFKVGSVKVETLLNENNVRNLCIKSLVTREWYCGKRGTPGSPGPEGARGKILLFLFSHCISV